MIKELIRELKTLDKYAWGQYTFKRDPIHNKVSSQEKDEMIDKANECGRQEAIALKNKYGSKSILEYAQQLGIRLQSSRMVTVRTTFYSPGLILQIRFLYI
jgi:hypothetical protein